MLKSQEKTYKIKKLREGGGESGKKKKMSISGGMGRKMSKLAAKSLAGTLFKKWIHFYNRRGIKNRTGMCRKTEKRGNMDGADADFSDGVCK